MFLLPEPVNCYWTHKALVCDKLSCTTVFFGFKKKSVVRACDFKSGCSFTWDFQNENNFISNQSEMCLLDTISACSLPLWCIVNTMRQVSHWVSMRNCSWKWTVTAIYFCRAPWKHASTVIYRCESFCRQHASTANGVTSLNQVDLLCIMCLGIGWNVAAYLPWRESFEKSSIWHWYSHLARTAAEPVQKLNKH